MGYCNWNINFVELSDILIRTLIVMSWVARERNLSIISSSRWKLNQLKMVFMSTHAVYKTLHIQNSKIECICWYVVPLLCLFKCIVIAAPSWTPCSSTYSTEYIHKTDVLIIQHCVLILFSHVCAFFFRGRKTLICNTRITFLDPHWIDYTLNCHE